MTDSFSAIGGKSAWRWAVLVGLVLAGGWALAQVSAPATPDAPATPAAEPKAAGTPAPATPVPAESAAPAAPMATAPAASSKPSSAGPTIQWWPLLALGVGIATVLGLIIFFKVNAFIALITAAIVVSLMADGDWGGKIARVATAFGNSAGGIGIVIALAAVIGKCMLDSGAADRIVRAFLAIFGVDRAPIALMGSGFVLAIPVFFDTVFYLLVPLARSMYRTTGKNYLLYLMAIAAGGAVTHTLVPPTPGPLLIASNLGFDIGMMIMMGLLIGLPGAAVGLLFAWWLDATTPVEMRPLGNEPEPKPLEDDKLPPLWMALAPVVLPVILISASTILDTLADAEHAAVIRPQDMPQEQFAKFQARIVEQAAAEGLNPGKRILERLPDDLEAKLKSSTPLPLEEQLLVIAALNDKVLLDRKFYDEDSFLGTKLNKAAKDVMAKNQSRLKVVEVERKNRALLESVYGDALTDHTATWNSPLRQASDIGQLFGDANFALLISTILAIWMVVVQRGLTADETAAVVEESLMSAGVIILITAGGGAFGAMLTTAKVGDAIQALFQIDPQSSSGITFLVLGFAIAMVLKIAQGSTTVAMITASAMLAHFANANILHFHPVYLACAIGSGGLMGSWMNDSGFWIFAKMGGLSETEALRSWTLLLLVLGGTCFVTTIIFAIFLPLV